MISTIKQVSLFIFITTILQFPVHGAEKIIIKLKSPQNRLMTASAQLNIPMMSMKELKLNKTQLNTFSTESTYIITLNPNADKNIILDSLNSNNDILYAEELYPIETFTVNDPEYSKQSYLLENDFSDYLNWPQGQVIRVGVIDSGIDYTHNDIKDQLLINEEDPINGIDDDQNGYIDDYYGYNFVNYEINETPELPMDYDTHGTHIAGIIGAKTNNTIGIAGINTNIKIINAKFIDDDGFGNQADAAAAIIYAVNQGAQILNFSWGFKNYNTILKEAVDYAEENGVIMVAAAGNSGAKKVNYPAGFESVIAVGSVDDDLTRSYFSDYGNHIDTAAIGSSIFGLEPNNRYTIKTGTSQSAATVTGITSLILSHLSNISVTELRNLFEISAQDIYQPGIDTATGVGLLKSNLLLQNISSILNDVSIQSSASSKALSSFKNYPNPIPNHETTFSFINTYPGTATIKIYDLTGRLVDELYQIVFAGTESDPSEVNWNASPLDLPNGTYIAILSLETSQGTQLSKTKVSFLR